MLPYFRAFTKLTSCRDHGGSIPWVAVDAYARRHFPNDEDDFEFFQDIIHGFELMERCLAKLKAEDDKIRAGQANDQDSDRA